ncbi:MAG: adenosylcobalamin-dependent ribonucleoside-diphosphate reductase [Nitrospirae bacterium]|nr:MAG: adenosylcobalamin-dependent ribonucleoside-diphosphate reductase [Nitrospirota bacterium]
MDSASGCAKKPCPVAPQLSPNALRVLEARYLRRDADGHVIETPEQLFRRVAGAIAQAEALHGPPSLQQQWEEIFFELLSSLDFLPNSPALMNAGLPLGQLSACFVLPIEDTMESIFETLKQAALVQRTGGGTGFSFSKLRPKGDLVHSTGGRASGPVSFMKIFDHTTQYIKQGGKRRGANMGVLRVDHPDIMEFITAKADGTSLHNFNISVGVTDAFMEAVRRGDTFELRHPHTHTVTDRLEARVIFETIVDTAWKTGDPGLLFLDAINRANPTPQLGMIEATNPCGEVPLLPNESCNLGSINLAHVLKEEAGRVSLDVDRLRGLVQRAVRFLDDLIDVNRYPNEDIERMSRGNRKIGLGVMGFAECLIRLGIPYGSDDAVQFGESVMEIIARSAHEASRQLAEERGVFPNWPESIYGRRGEPRRHATCTAIAPTGTISIIAGTTASIEPLFALVYTRTHSLGGKPLVEMTPLLWEYCQKFGIDPDAIKHQVFRYGRLSEIPGVPDALKRLFVTALDLSPEQHLQIQAAFQRHVDNSVSKTINLPEEATRDDVGRAYWQAWELGLKGITVYRYGSKGAQVLSVGAETEPVLVEHASQCDPCECQL